MKKILAPLAAAFTMVVAPVAVAQTQAPVAEPEQMIENLCRTMAADPTAPRTCTDAQKAQAIALLTEVFARPEPRDEYEAARYIYDVIEGLRLIFDPSAPAMPVPPVDAADAEAAEVCQLVEGRTGRPCTTEQRTQLRGLIAEMNARPEPTTDAERAARQAEISRGLDRVFPELRARPPAPRNDVPSYQPRIRSNNGRLVA